MKVAGLCSVFLLAAGWLVSHPDLVRFGASTSLIALVALYQWWRANPRALVILAVASGASLAALIVGREAHVALFPALTLYAFIGALALTRRVAFWFALWCAALSMLALPLVIVGITGFEMLIAGVLMAAINFAGWKFISLTGELITREEESHRLLFRDSPVAMLEEDFSRVAEHLERLRVEGVADIEAHLQSNLDVARHLITLITIRRANSTALQMIDVGSLEELSANFGSVERKDHELPPFIAQFVAIWEGRSEVAVDLPGVTYPGGTFEGVLHWSAPKDGPNVDLSRVIVTISDITPRKVIEERLKDALMTNQRLLDFEHYLTLCSRSLLMGHGESALEQALATLREAVGADRAYLSVNVDDPDDGLAFHVVKSTGQDPDEDEWMDRFVPWSQYPEIRDILASGRSFQSVKTEDGPPRTNEAVLIIPVFTEGRWAGNMGFMNFTDRKAWSSDAVRMLEMAAPMMGTFWEREMNRQRLEELVQSKDRFLASVSHELRTPLAAILGFAEELKSDSSDFEADEIAGMLEVIADQSQEMADMVEDLLVSARADIGTVTIRPQDVYLRSQAETVLAGIGSTDGKQIDVVGGRGKVWADPTRTRQIIRNLITNAIRYGGDTVVIQAFEGEDETLLTVKDNGPGLDPSEWEQIFEPYQRAHEVPTQPASIGLGLTVARQLARLMDGDLVYSSEQGNSVFSLTLPMREQEGPEMSQDDLAVVVSS